MDHPFDPSLPVSSYPATAARRRASAQRRAVARAVPLALAVLALLLPATFASAQARAGANPERDADAARRVASEVQSFYDQTSSFEASFVQTYYNRLYQRYERSKGRLSFDKPGRMRFDYASNGKVIVANGRTLTLWEPGDDGGAGQYARTEMQRSALPGAFSFLTGVGRLEETYRFQLLDPAIYRWSGHVLELRPRTPDPRFRRVLLFVDRHPSRAGLVHRVRIDDHDGNRNKFEMSGMRFNRDLPTDRFAFSPPQGARRIAM